MQLFCQVTWNKVNKHHSKCLFYKYENYKNSWAAWDPQSKICQNQIIYHEQNWPTSVSTSLRNMSDWKYDTTLVTFTT